MTELLYGKDPETGIVGIAPHGDKHVRVWTRNTLAPDLPVTQRTERIHPFIFVTDAGLDALKRALGANAFRSSVLGGENVLRHLAVFPTIDIFRKARRVFYDSDNLQQDFFTYGDPAAQYLLHSGKTMLKGLTPETAHRMQFDIEAYREDGFPDAEVDPIIVMSMTDNRGWKKVLYVERDWGGYTFDIPSTVYDRFQTEEEMLRGFIQYINRRDPDILEGHNVFAFDLPYIKRRCELYDLHFSIGRDGRAPYCYDAEKKFGERDIKYTNFVVGGRTIIDTMFLSIDWDVYTRKLDGVGLKDVARVLGVAPEGRTYIAGDDIARTWREDPGTVLRYALDDVYETRGVADQLISAQFALCQILPLPFQKVHLGGKASSIQSIFVREYIRQRASLPLPPGGIQKEGGYTDIFRTGVYDRVWYADVASLYPSIMLHFDIQPERDHLKLFQKILRQLTDLRFTTKAAMEAEKKNSGRYGELEARQNAFKIIINSFYGMLGAGNIALFATVSEADRVATTGQALLKRMIEIISAWGGQIIECDTDGILFVAPEDKDWETEGPAFCKAISDKMPTGIKVDFEGRFAAIMSLAKKNYALLETDGKVRMKGGSLKSRGLEPIFRDFIKDAIGFILVRDTVGLHGLYEDKKKTIAGDVDPTQIAKTITLKESLDRYTANVAAGENRAPQYEIGISLANIHGRRVEKGDRISFVIVGTKKPYKVRSFVDAKATEFVEPGTHNRLFYTKRLFDIATGRFGILFDKADLAKLFNPAVHVANQLAMFDAATFGGVSIQNITLDETHVVKRSKLEVEQDAD